MHRPSPSAVARRTFVAGCTAMAVSACGASSRAEPSRQLEWLAEVQQPPKASRDKPALSPLLVDDAGHAITTQAAWEKQRAAMQQRWQTFLGKLDVARPQGDALELKILAEDQVEGVLRQRIRYDVEPGLPTEAYLLRPAKAAPAKAPGVVVFHSTVNESIHQPAGVKGEAAKAFGLQLAKRGFVTICPRNYLWPENDRIAAKEEAEHFLKRQPKCLGMAKMLYDGQVALDILARQPDVDADRLGAVGHSLGGKEVLYLAAFDDRVKATVSSEGGIGISFSNWNDAWYLGPRVKEPGFALEHHELLSMVAPRAFLLVGGDSADGDQSWPFIDAALPVYRLYNDKPRLGLLNHKQGHSVPPIVVERVAEWCEAYL